MPEDMPDRMPENMPDAMSDRMPEDMPEDLPDRMPEDMPEHMPEDMPDRMPKDMSDRMPEDLPVRKCINVMVGITRSKVNFSIVFRIEPTIRYTLAMFFRKFPRFSGYSRPSSSTIRSALWENAHPSLAAVGLLLATAGGALLPTSVLSCSPRWSQEGQHQKTVTNCICKPKQHS